MSAHLVGHDNVICPHALQVPQYVWVLLGNMHALLFYCYSQTHLYSTPIDSGGTHGSTGALLSGEVGSAAMGRVAASEPS
jgi:hypothetical protein